MKLRQKGLTSNTHMFGDSGATPSSLMQFSGVDTAWEIPGQLQTAWLFIHIVLTVTRILMRRMQAVVLELKLITC